MHVLEERPGVMLMVSGQLEEEVGFMRDEEYIRKMRTNLSIYYTITVKVNMLM